MRAFQAFCRKQLRYVDELDACWLEWPEPPIDEPRYVVEQTRDRAARLGLVDVVERAPHDAGLDAARVYLAAALAACKQSGRNDLLTVTEVAGRLKVNRDKILGWINYGRLKAKNTAKGALGRPRWRIKPDDLEDFLAGRAGRV